jgi:hypothetical protein
MTQVKRVRMALERAGKRGVTPVDFMGPIVIDGGPPILRLAARILDLRNDGLAIEASTDPNGVARYVLVSEPGPSGEPVPPPVTQTEQSVLFP